MSNKNEKTIPKFCVLKLSFLVELPAQGEKKYLNEMEKDSNYIKITHRKVNRGLCNLSLHSKR